MIAGLYLVTGVAGRWLMLATGYASPLWPAAGFALAALLAGGRRDWPGLWLGAFLLSLGVNMSASGVAFATIVGTGVTLQALFGWWLAQRFRQTSAQLSHESTLLRLLLVVGPLGCVVSASFGVVGLLATKQAGVGQSAGEWLIWWAGDTIGVLLFAPLFVLAWPGAQSLRRQWRGVHQVALPLILTACLLSAGSLGMARFESHLAAIEVGRRIDEAFDSGFLPLSTVTAPLGGVTRLFAASVEVTRQEFSLYTEHIIRQPALVAVDWAPRVPHSDRMRFEAEVQREGLNGYRIFDLDSGRQSRPSAERAEYFPVLYSEPQASNAAALGLDHGFEAPRRAAMALVRGQSSGAMSVQVDLARTNKPALLVFLAVDGGSHATDSGGGATAKDALRGYVVGVFDTEKLLAPLAEEARRSNLAWRVSDVTPGDSVRVLHDNLPAGVQPSWRKEINIGGRVWRLQMQAAHVIRPAGASAMVLLYLGFAMLSALLAAFATLGSGGRIAATANEVARRTEELERELGARRVAEAALRESETNLEITLLSIGDAVLTTDAQRRVTRLNPIGERLTGWTQAEALGRPIEAVFHIINEQTRQAASIPVNEVLRNGEVHGLANHTVLVARDGTERAIAETAAPIRDTEGRLRGVVLVFRDVSQQRAAELALQRSEERYRRFVELSPFAVLVLRDGVLMFANAKAEAMFGAATQADLLGRSLLELVHGDSVAVMQERAKSRGDGRPVTETVEAKFLRLDGSVFVGELSSVPYSHDGFAGSLILLQDITARKEAEEERDRFFSLSLDLLCIAGVDGHFRRINPAFSHALGWSESELLAHPFLALVHPDDLDATRAELAKLAKGFTTLGFETRYRCKDGSWCWLEWKALPQPNGLIFATAHDTTASHLAEQQLLRLNAELIEAREDAEQASRAKSAFLATMSHEIRTPMNGVVGLIDVLARTSLTEHQLDLIKTVQDSSATLLGLIDDILDFSKIEAGKLEIERTPVCVPEVVEGLCSSLVHMASKRDVDLQVFVAPEVPQRVLIDEVRLRQVLYNLLGNAIKFSSGRAATRGRVSLHVGLANATVPQLVMRISDNGIGIAAASADRLFKPFTQAEVSTTRRYGGTGLGLAICKRVLDLMGGEITVQSKPGDGSTFTVVWPLDAEITQPEPDLADLSGVHCVVLGGEEVDGDACRIYLEHAGARVQVETDRSALGRLVESAAAPLVLVLGSSDEALMNEPALASRRQLGHVTLIRGGSRHAKQTGSHAVTLDSNALCRRVLLRAVAIAAGRTVAETANADGNELSVGDPMSAPDVDEARAQGRLILVADDDEVNQKVMQQQLALLGYASEVAVNGVEALQMWRQGGHALLLTDIHMPEMDGYRLTETIRHEEAGLQHRPILALTANALRGEARRAHEAGMDEYLTKPIRLDRLKEVLERWLPQDGSDPVKSASPDRPRHRSEVPTLNLDVLTAMVGDDPRVASKLLSSYRASAAKHAMRLKQSVAAGDMTSIGTVAHKLKSSSRSVGALALGEVCEELERRARAGDWPGVSTSVELFETVFAETEARLVKLLM